MAWVVWNKFFIGNANGVKCLEFVKFVYVDKFCF